MLSILSILMIASFVAAIALAIAWVSADRPRDAARPGAPLRPSGRRFLGA